MAAVDSTGVCVMASSAGKPMPGISATDNAMLIEAIAGGEWDEARFLEVGERVFNLERLLNLREGFGSADDTLPERFFTEPLTVGKKAGAVLDRDAFRQSLVDWCAERGWDPETAAPGADKLAELGLSKEGEALDG